jgi:hypothetical protein
MAIRGDKLTIKLQQNSSGTVNKVIAATTSVNVDMSAEALDTTSQDDGINATFIGGKLSGTLSGDYLLASDGEQYTNLYTHMANGDLIEWEVYRDGTLFLDGTGVIDSNSLAGGNADTLTTGAYSMSVEADDHAGAQFGDDVCPVMSTEWSQSPSNWTTMGSGYIERVGETVGADAFTDTQPLTQGVIYQIDAVASSLTGAGMWLKDFDGTLLYQFVNGDNSFQWTHATVNGTVYIGAIGNANGRINQPIIREVL